MKNFRFHADIQIDEVIRFRFRIKERAGDSHWASNPTQTKFTSTVLCVNKFAVPNLNFAQKSDKLLKTSIWLKNQVLAHTCTRHLSHTAL